MSFEPEDKQAWQNSEVMNEFEKIAQGIYDEADESFLPIKLAEDEDDEEETFEEENSENDEKIANEIFERLETFGSINKGLFDKIRTISHSLAIRGFKKEAFKIERMLKDLNGRNQ